MHGAGRVKTAKVFQKVTKTSIFNCRMNFATVCLEDLYVNLFSET